jgi:hypothetical protein
LKRLATRRQDDCWYASRRVLLRAWNCGTRQLLHVTRIGGA